MSNLEPTIRVNVDPANPGQYFACCGLLELAERAWKDVEAWFEVGSFAISGTGSLQSLLTSIVKSTLSPLDSTIPTMSPLHLAEPFNLRLDWWLDERAGGSMFKTWAGQQKVVSIASAMKGALAPNRLDEESLFNTSAILYDADGGKIEPFYLDARRAAQSHTIDVGFSPDAQKMLMPVFSTVEFLCLVGLQRFRPVCVPDDNVFEYATWHDSLPIAVAAAAASGSVTLRSSRYRFQLLYRTKYLKGFLPAIPVNKVDGENNYG